MQELSVMETEQVSGGGTRIGTTGTGDGNLHGVGNGTAMSDFPRDLAATEHNVSPNLV